MRLYLNIEKICHNKIKVLSIDPKTRLFYNQTKYCLTYKKQQSKLFSYWPIFRFWGNLSRAKLVVWCHYLFHVLFMPNFQGRLRLSAKTRVLKMCFLWDFLRDFFVVFFPSISLNCCVWTVATRRSGVDRLIGFLTWSTSSYLCHLVSIFIHINVTVRSNFLS